MLLPILLASLPALGLQDDAEPPALDGATRTAYEAAARYSEENGGMALVVRSGGPIVFESYADSGEPDAPYALTTATKSFWSIVAVAASDDGLFGLDDPVAKCVESWRGVPSKEEVTVRQLLQLESGIDADWRPVRRDTHDDKYAAALEARSLFRPGERFDNGPAPFFVFGALLTAALPEGDADVLAYVRRRLFEPAGIEVAHWSRDKVGNLSMPTGAYLTARDWSRFGQLLVDRGRVGERVVLNEATLADALTASVVNRHYCMGWWRASGFGRLGEPFKLPRTEPEWGEERLAYHAASVAGLPEDLLFAPGRGNQRLYLMPSLGLVVVRLAVPGETWSDAAFLRLLLDLPPVEEPVPDEESGEAEAPEDG